MKLSYDRHIVTFKCESEELFLAEKSGRKCNTVCILDASKFYPLTGTFLKQIIIQYNHEVFMRQITDFRVVGEVLEKYVVIFSWDHAILDKTDLNHKAHIMSRDEVGEPPIDMSQTAILIPRTLIADLDWHRGNDSLPEFISKLLNDRTGGGRR